MLQRPWSKTLAGLILCLTGTPMLAAPPVAVSPQGATTDECPTFSWSLVEGASAYELVLYGVGETGEVGTEPLLSTVLPAGVPSWTPSAGNCPPAGGSYAWSVRALDGQEAGVWSEVSLFQVSRKPSATEVETAIETLKRYLETQGEGEATGRTGEEETARQALKSVRRSKSRSTDEKIARTEAPLESETVSAAASVPTLGDPSLTVDANIALGADSNFFKEGYVFLWDDITGNLALGENALASASGDATENTALGFDALRNTTYGSLSIQGSSNVAVGRGTLLYNSTGYNNTAVGTESMLDNTTGTLNTALGFRALQSSDDSRRNVAFGAQSLYSNTSGIGNTAAGEESLYVNTTGDNNVAIGRDALRNNTTGDNNVALGRSAGALLGSGVTAPTTTMSHNVFIASQGVEADQEYTIRIGRDITHERAFIAGIYNTSIGSTNHPVCVDDSDQLGQCPASSARFKQDIQSFDSDPRRLLDLEPVAFRYRPGFWGGPTNRQIGLLAEDVAEVFPELVTRDENGDPLDVRYELLSVLLLEELQRQYAALERHDELDRAQTKEIRALRERLTALENARPPAEGKKPWWKRIFTRDRGSP